jgi:hypothetical protein
VLSRARMTRRTRLAGVALAAGLALGALGAPAASAAKLHKGFWGPTQVNGVSQFPIYKDLRVDIYQTGISWAQVAPTRPANPRDPADPAYTWPADIDYALQEAQRHGMRVLLMLTGAPPWANGGRSPIFGPDKPADFADFARAATRRYPAVRHWMIWGEPSRRGNFQPLHPQEPNKPLRPVQQYAPRRYARLLDAAYGQIKAQRRTNLVIGGNTSSTGDIRANNWVRYMRLRDGRPPRMDLYGHNPFSARTPRLTNPPSILEVVDFSDLGRFQRNVDRRLARPRGKETLRLFLSEFTVPTDAYDAEFNFHTTREVQARWITAGFRVARQLDSYALGWIHLYDAPPDPNGGVTTHGGLMTYDGQKKLGYHAFKRG